MSAISHIYIHVPFCSGKCSYCAFYSEPFSALTAAEYLDALQREIGAAGTKYSIMPKTIYIGGGTPLLLPDNMLYRLLKTVAEHFDLSKLTEWTIEGNPGNLTADKTDTLKKFGITRVSLGAQSMDNAVLQEARRRHTARDTAESVALLREQGFSNIGLDLIACLPGSTPAIWSNTLQAAIELAPEHLSVYALSIEPGTRLHQLQALGSAVTPIPEREAAELDLAEELLSAAGYDHYEVSNYARPGHRCRHNCAVWSGEDYIGFGPAASSRIALIRQTNLPDLKKYVTAPVTPRTVEQLSPATDAAERFMFSFRLYDGVDPRRFAANCGPAAVELLPRWLAQLAQLEQRQLVCRQAATWRLTEQGRAFADTVAAAMLPP